MKTWTEEAVIAAGFKPHNEVSDLLFLGKRSVTGDFICRVRCNGCGMFHPDTIQYSPEKGAEWTCVFCKNFHRIYAGMNLKITNRVGG